jgi:vacuolar iron transporter family protein
MARLPGHLEHHVIARLGWLRAAVLGANDGILSTAQGTQQSIPIAGVSGLVAGAMSMAAGEYVSVSSQSDSERADIGRERQELSDNRHGELRELAGIYVKRGLDKMLALQVAEQLTARDALGAHARDELGYRSHRRQSSPAKRWSCGSGSMQPSGVPPPIAQRPA